MASLCRSAAAAAAAARSVALRSRSPMARPFLAATSHVSPPCIRSGGAGEFGLESLMPLHSAVASARLRSCIAVDSACWSCLSQACMPKANTNPAKKLIYSVLPEGGYVSEHAQQHSNYFINGAAPLPNM